MILSVANVVEQNTLTMMLMSNLAEYVHKMKSGMLVHSNASARLISIKSAVQMIANIVFRKKNVFTPMEHKLLLFKEVQLLQIPMVPRHHVLLIHPIGMPSTSSVLSVQLINLTSTISPRNVKFVLKILNGTLLLRSVPGLGTIAHLLKSGMKSKRNVSLIPNVKKIKFSIRKQISVKSNKKQVWLVFALPTLQIGTGTLSHVKNVL